MTVGLQRIPNSRVNPSSEVPTSKSQLPKIRIVLVLHHNLGSQCAALAKRNATCTSHQSFEQLSTERNSNTLNGTLTGLARMEVVQRTAQITAGQNPSSAKLFPPGGKTFRSLPAGSQCLPIERPLLLGGTLRPAVIRR